MKKPSEKLLEQITDLQEAGAVQDKQYKCNKCQDTGLIVKIIDGLDYGVPCSCQIEKQYMRRLERSGLKLLANEKTFESYKADTPHRQRIKAKAEKYVADDLNSWLFIGGQVGAGKTHICTAVSVNLIKQGVPVRYMLWRDESTAIKAKVKYPEEYQQEIYKYKTIPVLYIDDLFKGKITEADINLAFEILNYRYNNNLKTIISSEYMLTELAEIDEAISSRILEKSKGYHLDIKRESGRNYRENKE